MKSVVDPVVNAVGVIVPALSVPVPPVLAQALLAQSLVGAAGNLVASAAAAADFPYNPAVLFDVGVVVVVVFVDVACAVAAVEVVGHVAFLVRYLHVDYPLQETVLERPV